MSDPNLNAVVERLRADLAQPSPPGRKDAYALVDREDLRALLSSHQALVEERDEARLRGDYLERRLEEKTAAKMDRDLEAAKAKASQGDNGHLIELAEIGLYFKCLSDQWRGIAAAMGYEPNAHLNVRPTDRWLIGRIAKYRALTAETDLGRVVEVVRTTRQLVADCAASGFTDEDAVRALFVNNGALTRVLSELESKNG